MAAAAQARRAGRQAPLPEALRAIEIYYSGKIALHGPTPLGVDWSCTPTQELRFIQLLKLCGNPPAFSVNDLGCGYGALLGTLRNRLPKAVIDYEGVDLSPAMVEAARRLWSRAPHARFAVGDAPTRVADYSFASGIFNVKLAENFDAWEKAIESVLEAMCLGSRLGFAVNFLRELPQSSATTPELYRASPARWTAYCASMSLAVEILDNYGMREFTLLCRKRN